MTDQKLNEIVFKIERSNLQSSDLNEYRKDVEKIIGIKSLLKYLKKNIPKCDSKILYNAFATILPCIDWICSYKWKEHLKYDLISGFTIGIMLIPQGLAYARLSYLPPETGLYMSFIVPLLYMLTGSSKSLSFGVHSIIAMMVGSVISSNLPEEYANNHKFLDEKSQLVPMNLANAQLIVSATLTFYTGIIQVAMSLFKMGFISNLLSSTTTNAFIFGSALQVSSTQVTYLIGMSVPGSFTKGISPVIKTYIYIFTHITSANIAEIVIAVLSIGFLVAFRYLNAYTEKKIHFPIPSELILIAISTGISYGVRLDTKYNVRIIGVIPSGFPSPLLPDFNIFPSVVASSITLAIVSYGISVSLAKGLASEKGEKISYNGELFSYGICNTIASFFQCIISGGSLSRSVMMKEIGKTQLSAVLSSLIIIAVLLIASKLFCYLPLTILSSTIVVALINVLKQGAEIKLIWKLSRFNALVWIVVVLSLICLDVQYAILIGVGLNLLQILYKLMRPKYTTLGEIGNTGIFEDQDIFTTREISSDIKIIQFSGPILYINFEVFVTGIQKTVEIMFETLKDNEMWGIVIIDGTYMSEIDVEGAKTLYKTIIFSYQKRIKIYLANTRDSCLKKIDNLLWNFKASIQSFPTVTDAVLFAKNEITNLNKEAQFEILPDETSIFNSLDGDASQLLCQKNKSARISFFPKNNSNN